MNFELHNTSQSFRFFLSTKEAMYTKAYEASQKNNSLMRASGLLIALSDLALAVAAKVATIGEAVIKGLANIFGALLGFKQCSALKGLKQIFIQLPLHTISLPLGDIIGIITKPVMIAITPINHFEGKIINFNNLLDAATELSKQNVYMDDPSQNSFVFQYA